MEIFSLNRTTPRLVKTVPASAPVLCLEYVKEPCDSIEEREAGATPTAAKTGNIICVGLQDGRSAISSFSFFLLIILFLCLLWLNVKVFTTSTCFKGQTCFNDE